MNKKRAQRSHAKRRAAERYDLALNRDDLRALVLQIQRNDATFVERQSLRISLFDMRVKGRDVRVVYDKARKTIVSFLPLEQPLPLPPFQTPEAETR